MKLKHNIYLMVFFCSFVPICFWILFSIRDTEARMESVVKENIEAITGSHVMTIESFCEGRRESMETISKYELVRNAFHSDYDVRKNEELNVFLTKNKANKSFVASMSVVDSEFHIVGSSENYEVYGISEFRDSNKTYHTGQFVFGNVHERYSDDGFKRVVPAYVGIFDGDELIGYLIEEIECTYFDRLRLQTDFLEEGTLYLVDGKHNIITAGTALESESRRSSVTTLEERSDYEKAWNEFDHENYSSGVIDYEVNGEKYITYFSDIAPTDWTIRVTENMSAQLESNKSLYRLVIVEGILMIMAIFLVQYMIAKRLSEPFQKIIDTLKRVWTNHDYSLRTNMSQKDEVGVIAAGIDELLAYIEKEELEEKRKQREFAEEARLKAEASNRAKSTFLFNASHDIRTPMNAIQGFAHMIEENPNDEKLVLDAVGKIRKASNTLQELLNNVLELSKIESGKDELNLQTVDLQEFSDKIYLMFAQEMKNAGISFELDYRVSDTLVRMDELKCTRILINMLGNAKKFTPEGGSVSLSICQIGGNINGMASYRMCVRDTGIGMSREFQMRAFEQFETERTSTISGVSGSGLGLSIIKKLTELMNGRCELESEQGKGTEIAIVLRLQIAERPEIEEEVCAHTADISGSRVLLVEDNELNREIARYLLESIGVVVEEAENGSVAVDRLRAAAPDYFNLVLMDLQMPVMDGYEATAEIRRLPNPMLASIPIVAMTANAFKEDREKCLAIGMNDHIGKPIDVGQLHAMLQAMLGDR